MAMEFIEKENAERNVLNVDIEVVVKQGLMNAFNLYKLNSKYLNIS